jgi:protein gp37
MGFNSSIEWTTHTFNPWWGCTKVSDGCKNCYAETLSKRYGHNVWGLGKSRRLMSDNHWQGPVKWNAEAERLGVRCRVFCASMADVFEENAPEGQLERLWELIRQTPNLDWQLLTKRPHRIADNLPEDWGYGYRNVWLGTSVEDEKVINRIVHLTTVPAIVHFLSLEPLLGPLPNLPLENIEWVIVGGESGYGARPMDKAWILDIRRQCRATGVAFFFKQWGGVNKKEAGRSLQGRFYNEMPNIPRYSYQV